ncbi:MAG TPA: YdeI/OmpD-associated family protein [Steroidobacteraceae bacterium]|jgi:uncharacterized protein YdeI (YjbR/CyaY-like superfamily)
MTPNKDSDPIAFLSAKDWERWLAKGHGKSVGVWLQFFKRDSGIKSLGHQEALAVALCYGWIDGQIKKHDADSWLRKFTPRRPNSIWSKRNCELVEQLTKSGKMRPAGLKEIAAAKADGRWGRAYDSPSKTTVPADFLNLLSKNRRANAHFKTLSKANIYAITWRLQTAKKAETREKRMTAIIEMLSKGQSFH